MESDFKCHENLRICRPRRWSQCCKRLRVPVFNREGTENLLAQPSGQVLSQHRASPLNRSPRMMGDHVGPVDVWPFPRIRPVTAIASGIFFSIESRRERLVGVNQLEHFEHQLGLGAVTAKPHFSEDFLLRYKRAAKDATQRASRRPRAFNHYAQQPSSVPSERL